MTTRPQTKPRRERRIEERETQRALPRRVAQKRKGLGLGAMTALAVLGGVALIVLAVALNRPSAPTDLHEPHLAFAPQGLAGEGFVLGRADAPVTVELYEDFQCPACERWGQSVFPSLAANEVASGTAKLVFRDLAFLGPESIDAALAGYAAAQQGRFWDMWATVYANQGHENSGAFSRDRLVAMASALGLDATRFVADMDSSVARSHLDASLTAAGAAGVSSTPTVVINGRLMTGASYPEIAAAIAAAR